VISANSDVVEDEATQVESKCRLPMFGSRFPRSCRVRVQLIIWTLRRVAARAAPFWPTVLQRYTSSGSRTGSGRQTDGYALALGRAATFSHQRSRP
jgi:hypothetical protein